VSYHVRALANLGLIKLVRTTPIRGAIEHHYKAVERTRVTNGAWGQVPQIVRQAMVDSTLEQVADYVGSAASGGGFDAEDAHLTRTGLVLDQRGWKELSRALAKLIERAEAIEEASKKRLAASDHQDEKQVGLVLMLFEAERLSQIESKSHPERDARRPPKRKASSARAT
jgi:hypothetical protein